MTWLTRRPWLWVVAAFVVLIAAWTVLIILGSKNAPERIEIPEGGFVGNSSNELEDRGTP